MPFNGLSPVFLKFCVIWLDFILYVLMLIPCNKKEVYPKRNVKFRGKSIEALTKNYENITQKTEGAKSKRYMNENLL